VAIKDKKDVGYSFKCESCDNDKCTVTDLGMMYGDEDWIYLLKCTNCGWSTRVGEYC